MYGLYYTIIALVAVVYGTDILGISSQITPLFSSGITIVDYAVMIAAAVLLLMFSLNNKISRTEGAIMLKSFVAYNIYLIYTQTI